MRPAHALKMKDLERATGVGRETIRFYIREGLLPDPARPGRNVAWYDGSFVERVALIKELQEKRFLPLHAIKAILGGGHALPSRNEVQTLLELDGKLFLPVAGVPAMPPVRLRELAQRVGLPLAEMDRLARAGAVAVVRRDGERWLEGDDIRVELPISLPEAVLGAKLDVPTPTGSVRMTVPKGANTGTVLRLKGKGAPRSDKSHGDEYVTLKVVLPERLDSELEEFVQRWQAGKDHNPRSHLGA